MNEGKVSQVIGAVVDVEFESELPKILNCLKVVSPGNPKKGIPAIDITLEVAAHIGDNKCRTIAMQTTDGLVRGMKVTDTGLPISVPVGKGTPAVSLGQTHGLILASDGSLWSWGSDWLGSPVLGLGNVTSQSRLHRIGNDTTWVSISAGISHNLAIKSDGTLWCWSQNDSGQAGDGTTITPVLSPKQVVALGTTVVQVAVGGRHTCARKSDGTL